MRVLHGVFLLFLFGLIAHAQDSSRNQADEFRTQRSGTQASGNQKQAKAAKKPRKASPPFRWVNPVPGSALKTLRHETFRSPSLGIDVGYLVLVPKAYGKTRQRYPVVYYLHGGRPGNECKSHRLAEPIDRIMKEGGVLPMIYVFVNGGPVSHYNMPENEKAQGASVFIKELIPHIDATYRTIASREGRGLEGFSQGGRGTMRLALRHPDLFCSAAAGGGGYATEKRISESGGVESPDLRFAEGDNAWDLARSYAARREGPAVNWMIYVGTKGFNYQNNLEYMDFLTSLGVNYQKVIVPGVPHSAMGIYDIAAERIMKFHEGNFRQAISR